MAISYAPAFIETLVNSRAVASEMFTIIENVPIIDYFADQGKTTEDFFMGEIEFKNVEFSYPSRPNTKVKYDI